MVKESLLRLLFPRFCFGCQREGTYLCQDCQSTLDILKIHKSSSYKNLKDLYWATPYQNFLIKRLIHSFKYEPFIKELSKPLSLLIINHFKLIEKQSDFKDFIIIPTPLYKKRLKWRGYNQAKEIAIELFKFFKIPLIINCLVKVKETLPQLKLPPERRKENILGAFAVKNKVLLKNKNILLIDDVYTTGSTLEECARILKTAGVREVIGIVVARG